jgi:hypothetical protein
VIGLRGSGKSSFLEHVACNYLENGHVLLDLFGSRDGEGLAWLRSPYAKDKKILLLRGAGVDIQASFPVKQADQLTLKDLENYDIIVSASPLYLNMDQEFYYAAGITDLLYKRLSWHRLIYVIVREAANFYYSRLKVCDNQVFAKSQMVYLIREARHAGLALGLDSIRYYAIDIDIRNLADYLILKSQGMLGLAEDLKWLYSFFNPAVVRSMPPENFIILTRTGALGLGQFSYPEWHKRERENILASVGIKVEYGEVPKQAEYRGTFKTVPDSEHAEIIRLYVNEGLGIHKIAERLKRSTRTVQQHIHMHDDAVRRSGFCPACRRVRSPCEGVLAFGSRKAEAAE